MRLTFLLFAAALCVDTVAAEDVAQISFPSNSSFLPKNWTEDPINAEIEPLTENLRERAGKIVAAAHGKYPIELREKFLAAVHIVGSLRFYDVGYGGTYLGTKKEIVLVYRESFDPLAFEQRFHHEFSSILLDQNEDSFESERWRAANESSFLYRAGGIIEEQKGDRSEATRVLADVQRRTGGTGSSLLKLDPDLMKQGFLTTYNQVSIEQDFNETTAHLFTNPQLWEFCRQFPRIDQKVDTAIDFFRRLDPRLDRLYFRQITSSALTP